MTQLRSSDSPDATCAQPCVPSSQTRRCNIPPCSPVNARSPTQTDRKGSDINEWRYDSFKYQPASGLADKSSEGVAWQTRAQKGSLGFSPGEISCLQCNQHTLAPPPLCAASELQGHTRVPPFLSPAFPPPSETCAFQTNTAQGEGSDKCCIQTPSLPPQNTPLHKSTPAALRMRSSHLVDGRKMDV